MEEQIEEKLASEIITEDMKDSVDRSVIKTLMRAKSALNLGILKNNAYLALCANQILVTFGLSIVYVHLASYALSIGFNQFESAALFSAMGISNFVGRVLFGLLGHMPYLTPIAIYSGGFFLAAVVIGVTPFAQSYPALMTCAILFGMFTGTFGTQLPQVGKYELLITYNKESCL